MAIKAPPSKPVYGPTLDTGSMPKPQNTSAGFSTSTGMYGSSPTPGPSLGGFGTAAGTMYGVKNIPVGNANLAFGVNPSGGVGGRVRMPFKKGGAVKAKATKKMAKGGTASKRADGCAQRGKTKGKMV